MAIFVGRRLRQRRVLPPGLLLEMWWSARPVDANSAQPGLHLRRVRYALRHRSVAAARPDCAGPGIWFTAASARWRVAWCRSTRGGLSAGTSTSYHSAICGARTRRTPRSGITPSCWEPRICSRASPSCGRTANVPRPPRRRDRSATGLLRSPAPPNHRPLLSPQACDLRPRRAKSRRVASSSARTRRPDPA